MSRPSSAEVTGSPPSSAPPSPSLVSLIALGIVYRHHPDWLNISLGNAARSEGVSAQRLSRLTTRAVAPFEALVGTLTRRGRPASSSAVEGLQNELTITRALLEVATSLLRYLPRRNKEIRDLVVGAHQRLQESHPQLRQHTLCEALNIPDRTLRFWLTQKSNPAAPPRPKEKRKKKTNQSPRRTRFDFEAVLPDTQIAADTSCFEVFGVPLKLIATQDVGGRDQDLLDSVIVDDHENAALVVQALQAALKDYPGAQAITDQGTPYMAKETQQALNELNVEHAPQREGEPTDKATVERAFRTVKDILNPVLHVLNGVTQKIPALHDVDIAKPVAKILLTMLLKSYQAGGRATQKAEHQRQGVSRQELAELAKQHRDNARKTESSSRLFLAHVHELYEIPGGCQTFVNKLRLYPLEVLKEAEKQFRRQVHRGDIKKRDCYFASVVRDIHGAYKKRNASANLISEQKEKREAGIAEAKQTFERWDRCPTQAIEAALKAITAQWNPKTKKLIADGAGAPRTWMRQALQKLAELHTPTIAWDLAQGIFHNFELSVHQDPEGDPEALPAIRKVFDQVGREELQSATKGDCVRGRSLATILGTDQKNAHSPPSQSLWN